VTAGRTEPETFPERPSRMMLIRGIRALRYIRKPQSSVPSLIVGTILRVSVGAGKYNSWRLFQLAFIVSMVPTFATRLPAFHPQLDVTEAVGGKRRYVSFKNRNADLSPDSQDKTDDLEGVTRERLELLGIADMGIIRDFELCRFSFGYFRMQAVPILRDKRKMDMPVRLRLFPPVRNDNVMKNQIYVVQQANQAIYVRLDERRVLEWLQSLYCSDMFTLPAGAAIGAGVLRVATRMDRFLEGLSSGDDPQIYPYLYTLLHSYAHLVMKQVSEYSGLDVGSLGEYVFPADLAFVVYRNGTTMDLGNLSAMWRNSGRAMLASLLDPRATQCGTGSLCTKRGGSCPDCLMIPETSCLASNKLVSRAVLRSIGGRPRFDTRTGTIAGYLDSVRSG
jgi:hypothetical protein